MKHIKFTFLFAVLISVAIIKVVASDITTKNEVGIKCYYNFINDGKELELSSATTEYGKDLVIPDSIQYKGNYYPVTSVRLPILYFKSIKIPNSVIKVIVPHYSSNESSPLVTLDIGKNVNSISGSGSGLQGWSLKKIIIHDIAAWCNINFGFNPLSKAGHLFLDDNTEITHLEIPEGVTRISDEAFYNAKEIKTIKLPSTLKSIGKEAFAYSGITALKIPDGVQMDHESIQYMEQLQTLSIGKENTVIGGLLMMRGLKSLSSFYCHVKDPIKAGEYAFYESIKKCTLYVPKGTIDNYSSAQGWKKFKNIFELTTITLNKKSVIINTSETIKLDVEVTPFSAEENIEWKSLDEEIATVNNGMLNAKKQGKTYIIATIPNDDEVETDTCEVTVIQPVVGIVLNETNLSFTFIGEMKQLLPTIIPIDASCNDITWRSSNETVCIVSNNGMVVATGLGQAIVIATTVDGGFVAVCKVTVKEASGIKKMNVEPLNGSEEIFNARGQRINKLQQGVNIIRMNDGTVKKIWIK